MSEELKLFLTVFLSINFSVIFIFLLYRFYETHKKRKKQDKVNHFGDSAEKRVAKYLETSFPTARLIRDVYLKTETGLTEIDEIFLCNRGIFIIEIKSHNGYIITQGKHWTQRWRDKVVRFHNPVYQNKVHKLALETILRKRQSLASLPVYTVTVFTSKSVSFSENVKDVIKLPILAKFIKNRPIDKRMKESTIQEAEKLIRNYMETNPKKQNRHRQRIYKNNEKKSAYRVNKFSVK